MTTINIGVTLVTIDCGRCGGTYAINSRYDQEQRENGGTWHCPYCQCSWGYVQTEVDRLKKELERKNNVLSSEVAKHDQTRAELADTERRRRAEKGAKTRLKNRISAGTCPCCDQSFSDLASHMKSAHPDFAATVEHDETVEENA